MMYDLMNQSCPFFKLKNGSIHFFYILKIVIYLNRFLKNNKL